MSRTAWGWILLVFAIVFTFGILVPKIQSVREVSVEQKAKLQLAANRQARLTALQSLSSVFAQEQNRVATIISALPPEPQVPELLVAVEALANQSSIGLQSILPQINTKERSVDLTLVGDGELGNIEAFLQGVSENARPMSVSSFTLVKNQGNTTRLSFNLVVTAPYGSAPAAASPAKPNQEDE